MNKSLATKIALLATIGLMAAGCNKAATTVTNNQSGNEMTQQDQTAAMPSPTPTVADASTASPTPASAMVGSDSITKTFTVSGQNFSFTPNTLTVNKGDKVKITFQNTGGFHDFRIDEFNVKTAQLGSGKSETVEFTADKTGTFEYYCSVGNHRAMGMTGKLTVK